MTRVLAGTALMVALLAALMLAWLSPNGASGGGPLYGDASCDGQINSIDAAVVLQHSAGLLVAVGCPENADVNDDLHINSLDAALILQFGAGLLPDLDPDPVATPDETPQLCPDGFFWNPNKGHCDSRECPPGFVFNKETLYCEPAVTQSSPTNTPVATPNPDATPVEHPEIYYNPSFWWTNTGIALQAGDRIEVVADGSVIYDNFHLQGVSPDGDGPATGWGPCSDHSLVGWVGEERPGQNADPATLDDVLCLGASFSGTVPTGGDLHISINDRNGFDNNVGQWYVTVTTY